MKFINYVIPFLLLFSMFMNCQQETSVQTNPKGYLFIIGGGKRPDYIMERFIKLADGKIVVLPMASGDPKGTAEYQVNQIKNLGAENVSYLIVTKEEAIQDTTVEKLNGVSGIFFSGGAQSRLMDAIGNTPFATKIKELYQQGAVIGGTSAGAAVMSKIMITGDEQRPEPNKDRVFTKIEGTNIVTEPGFGFLDDVIIDQHFVRRKRHNRLISLVLENPQYVGIGIDESTAVIVHPDRTFEIFGESQVIFYDSREATVVPFDSTKTYKLTAYDIKMHVLTNGYKINLSNNKITQPAYEEK